MIEINRVNKVFYQGAKEIHALREINLTIEQGTIFGVIGSSGAGKSTLIRCVNLLERPTSGHVIVDGIDLTQLSNKAADPGPPQDRHDLPALQPAVIP